MPITQKDGKWYWGSQGPFNTKEKAQSVAQAAHASGYKKSVTEFLLFQKQDKKYDKNEVQYDEANVEQLASGQKCGTCYYFQLEENKCLIVKGSIHDDMWCNKWEQMDYVFVKSVANITKAQIEQLNTANVYTIQELADVDITSTNVNLSVNVLKQLQAQARLQLYKIENDINAFELLPLQKGRGLNRLPTPSDTDLFFDMEGIADSDSSLDYLFGVYHLNNSEYVYKEFWSHDLEEEKLAFSSVLNFFKTYIDENPDSRIYHFNHYEPTSLRKLSQKHNLGSEVLEGILSKFVDLYQVIREGVMVSEPRYRLKNIEKFYMPKREDTIVNALTSMDTYKQWQQDGNVELLKDISNYNFQDCLSTKLLRDWLNTIKSLYKEDGIGNVFTSDNPGIYTPTYGKYKKKKKTMKKQSTTIGGERLKPDELMSESSLSKLTRFLSND